MLLRNYREVGEEAGMGSTRDSFSVFEQEGQESSWMKMREIGSRAEKWDFSLCELFLWTTEVPTVPRSGTEVISEPGTFHLE